MLRMNTNDKFEIFLKEHFSADKCGKLLSRRNYKSHLMNIATKNEDVHCDVLILIERFLESISTEEATEYINNTYFGCPIIFYCEDVNLMKVMIKYVRNVNVRTHWGTNALMFACVTPLTLKLERVKLLLDCKIDINTVNERNESALAIYCEHVDHNTSERDEIIQLLIFYGANPFIKSSRKKIAADYVVHKNILSERSHQLLQGIIKVNNTKRAI